MATTLGNCLSFVVKAYDRASVNVALRTILLSDGTIACTDGTLYAQALLPKSATAAAPPAPVLVHADDVFSAVKSSYYQKLTQKDGGDAQLSYTAAGNLRMKIGKLSVIAKVRDAASFPIESAVNDGDELETFDLSTDSDFFTRLRALRDFCGTDATRAWTLGVRFEGASMYATNNVMLAMSPLPFDVGTGFTIPTSAIDAVIDLAPSPKMLVVPAHRGYATFAVSRRWWLRTACISVPWASESVNKLFATDLWQTFVPRRISDDVREAMAHIVATNELETAPVYITSRTVRSSIDDDEANNSTEIACDEADYQCAVSVATATRLLKHAVHADFSQYPQPVPFVGKFLRGISACYADAKMKARAAASTQQPASKKQRGNK